jgi:hypothetical protein
MTTAAPVKRAKKKRIMTLRALRLRSQGVMKKWIL